MEETRVNNSALNFENGQKTSVATMFKIITKNLASVLNAGFIFLSFFESYLFPFTIIKWIIIVTKYSGIIARLNGDDTSKRVLKSRHRYKLLLITTGKFILPNNDSVERISHVSMLFEEEGIQLSYCGQDCRRIPPALQTMYGAKVKCLDLSYNTIETLKGLEQFARLEELILDNNKLGDSISFPYLGNLRTLSINNNEIIDLEELVNKISRRFPSLTYLSLLSNKACPNQLSDIDKDDSDYQRYRYFVIYMLPNLRFLDSRRVSSEERREAAMRGEFMRVRRPPSVECIANPPPVPAKGTPVRALPVDFGALGKHRGAYGKCSYKYTGKHSEGNRFIVNSDL